MIYMYILNNKMLSLLTRAEYEAGDIVENK